MNYLFLVIFMCILFLTRSFGNIRVELTVRGALDDERDIMKTARQTDVNRSLRLHGTIRKEMATMTLLDQFNSDVICSPVAILMSLLQLTLGSKDATLNELENAVGVKRNEVPKESSHLLEVIKTIGFHRMVTRMFFSRSLNLRPKFKEDLLKVVPSQIRAIDFGEKANAAKLINNWVKKQTRNNIRSIISSSDIRKNTQFMSISTVVFKCDWKNNFQPAAADTFHSPSGGVKIAMMSQRQTLRFHENENLDAKLIEIPIKRDAGQFLIVLPNKENGLRNVLNVIKTNLSQLSDAYTRMSMTEIELKMPKFRIETELNMEPLLKLLGVKNIFSPGDGLTRIVERKTIYMSSAFQKCVIEVNEGNITGRVDVNSNVTLPRSESKKININHPFLFYIIVRGEQVAAGIYNGRISKSRNQDMTSLGDDYLY